MSQIRFNQLWDIVKRLKSDYDSHDHSEGIPGNDTTAIHVDEALEINGITNKATLAANDEFVIEDSADSYNKKKARRSAIIAGLVDTSGTPVANDYARFTDADTIEGRSYSEVRDDLELGRTRMMSVILELPTASEAVIFMNDLEENIEVTDIKGIVMGTTPSVTIRIGAGTAYPTADHWLCASTAVTATAGSQTITVTNGTDPAVGDMLWLTTSAMSGTVNWINVTIYFKYRV